MSKCEITDSKWITTADSESIISGLNVRINGCKNNSESFVFRAAAHKIEQLEARLAAYKDKTAKLFDKHCELLAVIKKVRMELADVTDPSQSAPEQGGGG